MANTQTVSHLDTMDASDLTTWLVTHAARVRQATSVMDVLRCTVDAVSELVPAPVSVVSCAQCERAGQPPDAVCMQIVPDLPRGRACLRIGTRSLTPDHHAAISGLLTTITPLLAELLTQPEEIQPAAVDPDVAGLTALLDDSSDGADLVGNLVRYCGSMTSATGVAIVRNDSLMFEETWLRAEPENLFDARAIMRQLAGELWPGIVHGPAAAVSETAVAGLKPFARAYGVRIAGDGAEPLVLTLYYPDSTAHYADDVQRLERIGATLRESPEFQSLLNTTGVGYTFADALNEVTLTAASTHELSRLYEAVRDVLARVLPLDALLIAMIPAGEERGFTVYRSERDTSYFERVPLSEPFQLALKHGSPFIVDEIPQELTARQYRFGDPGTPVRSLAAAPLVTRDRIIGLIVAQSYDPAAFKTEHGDFLLHIGRSIAGALERAELLGQLQHQAVRETALRRVTERVTTALDPHGLLDIVVSELAPALEGACVAAVYMPDASTTQGPPQVAVRGQESLRPALGIASDLTIDPDGAVARTLETGTVQDYSAGGTSVLTLPLLADSDCIGAMAIARQRSANISDDEYTMIATLSGTLAAALQTAQLYVERSQYEQDLLEMQRISRLVASSLDTSAILQEIVTSLPQLFEADGCYVRIVDGDDLVPLTGQGTLTQSVPERVPIATSIAGSVVREKKVVSAYDLQARPDTAERLYAHHNPTRGWAAAPLIDADGSVLGILSIRCEAPRTWTERDLVLLRTMADTTSVAIQNAWRFERTRDVLLASIESLANAVDAKDPTTLNHSRNVSDYARKIAVAMGCSEADVEATALAGLLHDIGKIGIPDRILQKVGPLDEDEWEHMRTHPVIGEQILSGNPHLKQVLPLVRHHHERWDGGGYPDGLEGDEIPLGAAIVALADAIETMASNRPYHRALDWACVCATVREEAGHQFHPDAVRAFLELVANDQVAPPVSAGDIGAGVGIAGTSKLEHLLDPRAAMIFHSVAREVRALTDLDTFIANVTLVIREVMDLSDVHIFLVDEHTGEIVYRPTLEDRERGLTGVRRKSPGGVVGWVIEHGQSQLVPDVTLDDRFEEISNSQTRSELAVPLIADGTVIGAINVESPRVAAFSETDERLLSMTAAHLSQTIQVARLHDRFKQLASTDALTGLPNHRRFYERLDEEIRHALVTDGLLTVAIMDVNQLKEINDTYGHLAGDTVLREIAATLRERCRRADFVARYGGDEFAFILPDTDLEGANRALAHIAAGLESRSVILSGQRLTLPTGAWGLAAFPDDGMRSAELVRVADLRMYNHKNVSRSAADEH